MSHRRKRFLWLLLVVVGLVSVAAAAASRGGIFARKAPTHSAALNPANASGQKERLGYAAITLTRFGFEPAEITRSGGRFFLVIENRSGVRNPTLRLDAEHGNRIREVVQPADQLDWVDEVNLPPGRYRISTADQPDRVCLLTVTP